MWIPDPRFEEPNLLVPGKKPVGRVNIDATHPLARNLTLCSVFGRPDAGPYPAGTYSAETPYRIIGPDVAVGAQGLRVEAIGSGLELGQRPIHSGEITLLCIADIQTIPSTGQLICGDNFASGKRDFQFRVASLNSSLLFIRFIGGVARTLSSSFVVTSGRRAYVATHKSGSAAIYADGVAEGSASDAGDLDADIPSISVGCRLNVDANANTGDTFDTLTNSSIECVMVWSRALSVGEVRSISSNPYQLLVPA